MHSSDSAGSVVHHGASQLQHQSGGAVVSAAAVASAGAAASACGLEMMGDGERDMSIFDVGSGGIFGGPLLDIEGDVFEVETLADARLDGEDFYIVISDFCICRS